DRDAASVLAHRRHGKYIARAVAAFAACHHPFITLPMTGAEALGHDQIEGLAEGFVSLVAEDPGRRPVPEPDLPRGVGIDDPVGTIRRQPFEKAARQGLVHASPPYRRRLLLTDPGRRRARTGRHRLQTGSADGGAASAATIPSPRWPRPRPPAPRARSAIQRSHRRGSARQRSAPDHARPLRARASRASVPTAARRRRRRARTADRAPPSPSPHRPSPPPSSRSAPRASFRARVRRAISRRDRQIRAPWSSPERRRTDAPYRRAARHRRRSTVATAGRKPAPARAMS